MALDPLLSPKPKTVTADNPSAVRVKATSRGVYGGIVREPGTIFYVDGSKHQPAKSMWMQVLPDAPEDEVVVVDDETPAVSAKKPQGRKPSTP